MNPRTFFVAVSFVMVGLVCLENVAIAEENLAATADRPAALAALDVSSGVIVSEQEAHVVRGTGGFFPDFLTENGNGFKPDFLSADSLRPTFLVERIDGSGFSPDFLVEQDFGLFPDFLTDVDSKGFFPSFLQAR